MNGGEESCLCGEVDCCKFFTQRKACPPIEAKPHSFPLANVRVCPLVVCAPFLVLHQRLPHTLSLCVVSSFCRSSPMSSDSDNETSAAASIVQSVMESLQQLPASSQSHYAPASGTSPRQGGLFGPRQRRVHDMLGGGHSADVLLWRKKHLSAGFLLGATVVWFLFEWIGYHFVSVVSFLLLAFVVILFSWSSLAAFLNRDPPPVPRLQLSDKQVYDTAKTIQYQVNKALVILYEIVIGKDVKRFLKLVGVLSFLVIFGSWFSFLSLVFIAIVAAHTLPVLYEKHGNSIDEFADSAVRELNNQYRKFDATVLNRIPRKQPGHQRKTR